MFALSFTQRAIPTVSGYLQQKKGPYLEAFRHAPERIRTSDLRFRRPTLYPAELRALTRGF